ncbi:hypothetical protein GmHk_15G044834 [Glycine max]|nr:hypothetical protein GmHk_15G044834 [Glycine max]
MVPRWCNIFTTFTPSRWFRWCAASRTSFAPLRAATNRLQMQHEGWVSDVRHHKDQVSQMMNEMLMSEEKKWSFEAAKADFAMGLKHREAAIAEYDPKSDLLDHEFMLKGKWFQRKDMEVYKYIIR